MRPYIFLFKSLVFVFSGLLILAFFSFRPVPRLTNCNSKNIKATVINAYSTNTDHLVFELEGIEGKFYIHRLEKKAINEIKAQNLLINQEIEITYPKQWSIFDPFNRTKPIFKIICQEEIIFRES